jgi:hypothetical protein
MGRGRKESSPGFMSYGSPAELERAECASVQPNRRIEDEVTTDVPPESSPDVTALLEGPYVVTDQLALQMPGETLEEKREILLFSNPESMGSEDAAEFGAKYIATIEGLEMHRRQKLKRYVDSYISTYRGRNYSKVELVDLIHKCLPRDSRP